MGYSQFGAMIPELIILGIFLVVFVADVFSRDGSAKKFLTPMTTVLFGLGTIAIWLLPSCEVSVFGGMYVNDTASMAIKAILNIGVFIVLLSALGYALYITTVNKFLAGGSTSRLKIGGRKLTFYVFVVSTALFAIKAGTNQGIQPIPDSMSFVNLILLAIVPTVISNITLVLAVHNIGGTLTAVLGAVEPITAVCVGILVFSEPFTPNLAVGILLIIIAVTMIILSKSIQGTLRKIYRKAAHFQVSK